MGVILPNEMINAVIEQLMRVGARRHPLRHLLLAVTPEQGIPRVYGG